MITALVGQQFVESVEERLDDTNSTPFGHPVDA